MTQRMVLERLVNVFGRACYSAGTEEIIRAKMDLMDEIDRLLALAERRRQ